MDKVNQEHSKLLNAIEHWLGGLQELRRYTAYGRLARQMQKASGDYVKANKQNYKYQAISEIINGFGNALSQNRDVRCSWCIVLNAYYFIW